MLEIINNLRIEIAKVLQTTIISNNFVFIDVWSFVHFFVGFYAFKFFNMFEAFSNTPFKWKAKFIIFMAIFYEIFEFILIIFEVQVMGSAFIRPESALDILWDIIIGPLGALVAYFIIKRKRNNKNGQPKKE